MKLDRKREIRLPGNAQVADMKSAFLKRQADVPVHFCSVWGKNQNVAYDDM